MLTASPPPALVPLLSLAAAVLAVLAATGAGLDTPGRVLVGAGAVVMLGAAALAAGSRPVITVDDTQVEIRLGWRRHRLNWAQIVQVRADRHWRSRSLEIDLGDTLIVVPAFLLGGPSPAELAAAVEARRPGNTGALPATR